MNFERLYLPHSTKCFVCGIDNEIGLKHIFYVENNTVCSDILIPDGYNGFKGIVHGGIASALLDETLGWCAYVFSSAKNLCFTRMLQIKFKKSLHIKENYRIITEFVEEKRGLYTVKGYILDKNNIKYIEADGHFVEISDEKMKETIKYLLFDKNKKYFPKIITRIKELTARD
ncbi:hotdog fold domain-containing protein [Deferribacter thermophilus]|uniref:hotdog fold domain-containing protein n=1 Tax=Deferribacter thermophilus TaxID=53573 RepID=UPI003C23E27F